MEKPTISKMYRVFDSLFFNLEDAEKCLIGWEHKEKITTVFVVDYDKNKYNNMPCDEASYFSSDEQNAINELKSWIELMF